MSRAFFTGNITTLSQAITLVESSNPDHYAQAQEIIETLPAACREIGTHRHHGRPGSRKIDLHRSRRQHGHLAASTSWRYWPSTPSSERSGGSILGDKTRMESISSQSQGLHPPLPFGRVARRRSPQNPRDDHPVRSCRIRRHLHRNGRRRDSPKRPYIRWSICS